MSYTKLTPELLNSFAQVDLVRNSEYEEMMGYLVIMILPVANHCSILYLTFQFNLQILGGW